MGSGGHAGRRLLRRQAGAQREAAADALGDRHDVRRDAGPFMGEEPPVRPMPHCTSSKISRRPCSSQSSRKPPQALRRHRADAALALHRLDEDAGGLGPDRGLQRVMVAEGHLVEAFDLRPEAFEILRLAAGGDGGQGPAMEGALRR